MTIDKKFQGLAAYRYKQNPLEEEFAKQWETQNNGSRPTLAYILSDPPYTQDPLNYPSERDWDVANSVIQWLGSPVGQAFLQDVFSSRAGQNSGFCYYTEKRVRREKEESKIDEE